MRLMKRQFGFLFALLIGLAIGCNDGGMPVGGQFDAADKQTNNDRGADQFVDDRDDAGGDRIREGFGNDRRMPSDERGWGKDRRMPSDRMPSTRGGTGRDRKMPSDSKPSKTSRWGKDRKMPSDSKTWGKGREMPSDRMKRRKRRS